MRRDWPAVTIGAALAVLGAVVLSFGWPSGSGDCPAFALPAGVTPSACAKSFTTEDVLALGIAGLVLLAAATGLAYGLRRR